MSEVDRLQAELDLMRRELEDQRERAEWAVEKGIIWRNRAEEWEALANRRRLMYRERFNEGLSDADWHRKHCAVMRAVTAVEAVLDRVVAPTGDGLSVRSARMTLHDWWQVYHDLRAALAARGDQ